MIKEICLPESDMQEEIRNVPKDRLVGELKRDIRDKDVIVALTALDLLISLGNIETGIKPGCIKWNENGSVYHVEYRLDPKKKTIIASYMRNGHNSSKKTIMNSLARMKNDRKSIATKVSSIIDEAEYMRNSYFWSPPSSSSSRRWYEKQHSYPETCWEEGGNSYSARFDVACSCRNIYASGTYTKNDTKTNLAAIRSSLERMERSLNLHEEYGL